MKISYDPKCEELARWFLNDEYGAIYDERLTSQLAGVIQQAIENWFENQPANISDEPDEGEDESGQGAG
jgi:hypothetical protein